MHGCVTTLGVILSLFISGCQDSQYLTRAEFDAWKVQQAIDAPAAAGAGHEDAVARLYQARKAIKQAIRIHAENLANTETVGYKAARIEFADEGASVVTVSDFSIGSPRRSGSDFDVMIQGEGFFRLRFGHRGESIAFTRAGNFYRNRDGDLVMGGSNGPLLDPVINVPQGVVGIEISSEGVVFGVEPGSVSPIELGRIELVGFTNPRGLQKTSGVMFLETQASGPPILSNPGDGVLGTILQGFLESSNVDRDIELAEMTLLKWRYDEITEAIRMLTSDRAAMNVP